MRSQVVFAMFVSLPLASGWTLSSVAGASPKASEQPTPTVPATRAVRIDLPRYVPPVAYSEDLVVQSDGKTIVMKRSIDGARMRTELSTDGQDMVLVELGDEKGTMYTIMPSDKRAMKQSREAMEKAAGPKSSADSAAVAPADYTIEDLGEETLGGVVAHKLRVKAEGSDVLAWFDKTSGAPLRMESKVDGKDSVIEWKNRKAGPQPAANFEIPKGYEVTDMDEMMSKMGAMGGMGAMAKGMAGGMAGSMLGGMGSSLGGQLGGMLGGPLGSIAGQYIGGKIGHALAHKVTGQPG